MDDMYSCVMSGNRETIGDCYTCYYLIIYLLKSCIISEFRPERMLVLLVGYWLHKAIVHEKSDCYKSPHFKAGNILKMLYII